MIAETLAVIGAANAAIGQVKTLIGHGQDISASVDGIIDKANVLKDYYLPEFNAVAFKSATAL